MWFRSCRPEVRIRQRVCEKIRRISNLLKTFEVRTLSNSNANFVTSLAAMAVHPKDRGKIEVKVLVKFKCCITVNLDAVNHSLIVNYWNINCQRNP